MAEAVLTFSNRDLLCVSAIVPPAAVRVESARQFIEIVGRAQMLSRHR